MAAPTTQKTRYSIREGNPRQKLDAEAYGSARARLRKARGRAEDQKCRCGQPARYWTVKRDAKDRWLASDKDGKYSGGLVFSREPDEYEALCAACRAEDQGRSTTSSAAAPARPAARKPARRGRRTATKK